MSRKICTRKPVSLLCLFALLCPCVVGVSQRAERDDQESLVEFRRTAVYVKRGSQWQTVASQATRLPSQGGRSVP